MDLSQFTLTGLLVQQIRDEIIQGNLKPGHALKLRDLADQFSVSTQPIREALRELETEGLVKTEPRKGATVRALSVDELADIYEMRATLESMAARSAVPHISAETFTTLEGIIATMDTHIGEAVELVSLNKQFHMTLYRASGRKHLNETVSTLRNHTAHYLHAYVIDQNQMLPAQEEHRAILDACKSGDVEAAATITYRHVLAAGNGIIESIQLKLVVGNGV